jgi:hypothetical protein
MESQTWQHGIGIPSSPIPSIKQPNRLITQEDVVVWFAKVSLLQKWGVTY